MAAYLLPFLASAILAVLHHARLVRLNRTSYALALLFLALFAGLRFEVGQDWPAYKAFFQDLNLSTDIFALYSEPQQFEIGYYLLNYAVKGVGGTYHLVFVVAALFLAFSLYRFTKHFAVNRFYILTVYISYAFLLLNFAQVRQAISVGIFLLACDYYLKHQKRYTAVLIAAMAVPFQYSSLMYVTLFIGVIFWPKKNQTTWAIAMLIGGGICLYIASRFTDFYSLLAMISSTSAEEKLAVYKETQEDQGSGQIIYACYLLLLAWYLTRYSPPPRDRSAEVRHFTPLFDRF